MGWDKAVSHDVYTGILRLQETLFAKWNLVHYVNITGSADSQSECSLVNRTQRHSVGGDSNAETEALFILGFEMHFGRSDQKWTTLTHLRLLYTCVYHVSPRCPADHLCSDLLQLHPCPWCISIRITKDMGSDTSQTTLAIGLSECILVPVYTCRHILIWSLYHLGLQWVFFFFSNCHQPFASSRPRMDNITNFQNLNSNSTHITWYAHS